MNSQEAQTNTHALSIESVIMIKQIVLVYDLRTAKEEEAFTSLYI